MDILTLKVFLEVDMDTLMGVHMGILTLDCAFEKKEDFELLNRRYKHTGRW